MANKPVVRQGVTLTAGVPTTITADPAYPGCAVVVRVEPLRRNYAVIAYVGRKCGPTTITASDHFGGLVIDLPDGWLNTFGEMAEAIRRIDLKPGEPVPSDPIGVGNN